MPHDDAPVAGYRFVSRLGTGGFSEVWEGTNREGHRVALKIIEIRGLDPAQLRAEIRVLRTMRDLEHPNIIRLHDVSANARSLVLVMERADGNLEELRQAYRAETSGDIPPDHLLELLEQAAEGLDYFAALRVSGYNLASGCLQHCDVKPTNLLLLGNHVKVADFGLCAGMWQRSPRGGVRGTPLYAAPEQYLGRVSDRTDQYALAVTWCDLVGGGRLNPKVVRTAANFVSAVDLMRARTCEASVLARALHEDPTRRWPSCKAFVAALREAVMDPRRASGKVRRPARFATRPHGAPAK
jgi:serine/threonine protein kinase